MTNCHSVWCFHSKCEHRGITQGVHPQCQHTQYELILALERNFLWYETATTEEWSWERDLSSLCGKLWQNTTLCLEQLPTGCVREKQQPLASTRIWYNNPPFLLSLLECNRVFKDDDGYSPSCSAEKGGGSRVLSPWLTWAVCGKARTQAEDHIGPFSKLGQLVVCVKGSAGLSCCCPANNTKQGGKNAEKICGHMCIRKD